jgi:hypothetical protein
MSEFLQSKKSNWLVGIPVILALFVFINVVSFEWLNWDDGEYVLNNTLVGEFTINRISENFSDFTIGAYHPLTTLSYCIDYTISGYDAGTFHVGNLVIHCLNIILLFFFARKLTSNIIVGLIASSLFAIHPMNIESVCWIADRKDLLMTFFLLIGSLFYLSKKENNRYYIFCFIAFLFALLSKGTALVFPVILLLFDYLENGKITLKDFQKKVPFFITSILFGIIAKLGQQDADEMGGITDINFINSLVIGTYNYVYYLAQFFVPVNLSGYHPYPFPEGTIPNYFYACSLLVIVTLVVWFKWFIKNRIITFSLGFYSVSIFLLLQIFPFGEAMSAERFTYFHLL